MYETVFIPVSYGLFIFSFLWLIYSPYAQSFPRSSNLHKCSSPYLWLASRNMYYDHTEYLSRTDHNAFTFRMIPSPQILSLNLRFIFLPRDQSTVTGRLAISFVVDWGITSWPSTFLLYLFLGRAVHTISCLLSFY